MSDVRFYKYFFMGIEKPIIMEAENKTSADMMLNQLSLKSKVHIDLNKLIDMRIETPIVGISTRKRKGQQYVWVGKKTSSDGWMLKTDFEQIENLNKQKL